MGFWARLGAGLLDVLSPPQCCACDAPTLAVFCARCGSPEPLGLGELSGVPLLVAGNYAPPLSEAIVRFKYANRPDLSRPLARLLTPPLRALELPSTTPLVPVPLHARRLATRGYNQATLLAQELARDAELTCLPRFLARTRETEQQVGKARGARLTNALGAFELRQAVARQVVLVDDVITTGSTVRACAQALAAGGVQVALIMALARARGG